LLYDTNCAVIPAVLLNRTYVCVEISALYTYTSDILAIVLCCSTGNTVLLDIDIVDSAIESSSMNVTLTLLICSNVWCTSVVPLVHLQTILSDIHLVELLYKSIHASFWTYMLSVPPHDFGLSENYNNAVYSITLCTAYISITDSAQLSLNVDVIYCNKFTVPATYLFLCLYIHCLLHSQLYEYIILLYTIYITIQYDWHTTHSLHIY
jgi:hypothetical protein